VNPAARALLTGLIDYAGLFPPAALSMQDAARNYAAYRAGEHAWILGRFILPADRLDEFLDARRPINDRSPWSLSVLATPSDAESISAFNSQHAATLAKIDAVELKTSSEHAIRAARDSFSPSTALFCELPYSNAPDLLATLAEIDSYAKLRTGGLTPDAIPPTQDLFAFLQSDIATQIPFKATAGLHHPLRGEHPLTPQPGAPTAMMHGFLNLFVAAAVLYTRVNDDDAIAVLNETDPAAFTFIEDELHWRDRVTLAAGRIAEARSLALSFGSCSFEDPIADLKTLAWL
jgi:hypothetical protein